jgi:spermidine synthase
VLGGNELMSSRVTGSEKALAVMTCERLGCTEPHLLIGGYGMGFTLRAAREKLGRHARLTVVEVVPEIIKWAQGPMKMLSDGCLDDPRVTVMIDDVAEVIGRTQGGYNAILLDVDNGPHGLTRDGNDRLYSAQGLAAARMALASEGVLAVWSAVQDRSFMRRMGDAGFMVEEVIVRATGKSKGPRHLIYFGRRR